MDKQQFMLSEFMLKLQHNKTNFIGNVKKLSYKTSITDKLASATLIFYSKFDSAMVKFFISDEKISIHTIVEIENNAIYLKSVMELIDKSNQ